MGDQEGEVIDLDYIFKKLDVIEREEMGQLLEGFLWWKE